VIRMKKITIGITAHVDAGKTTLAEAILCRAGKLRKAGRVDCGNTLLDSHELEKKRGITIFSGESGFIAGDKEINLIDTPGHIDFSAETERILDILDYSILVISGTNGVQPHTRTLWKLLAHYEIPVFIFITKMDYSGYTEKEIMKSLQAELSDGCISFSDSSYSQRNDSIALRDENILDSYINTGIISDSSIAEAIRKRKIYPCSFGSGLKMTGIDNFIEMLSRYTLPAEYHDTFGAKVYKITYDTDGKRETHLKITGGKLAVRDSVSSNGKDEKVTQIRKYSGMKFETISEAQAGDICAVTGLSQTMCGEGLGFEANKPEPVIEAVMRYQIKLPSESVPTEELPKLKQLEEEDPQLHIEWNSASKSICASLMGAVQAEILQSLIMSRFNLETEITPDEVVYRETIQSETEGVGHYEPLRHYSEVHLILTPLPRGSGIIYDSQCPPDSVEPQYIAQVMSALQNSSHKGVLTGSKITDIKITFISGKSHIKHTSGGDFREAAMRALRCGLMHTSSILLEPYYAFVLQIPGNTLGRAMNDIRMMHGSFGEPEQQGSDYILRGKSPVSTMNSYQNTVAAYTGGNGKLFLEFAGYDRCHNTQEVVSRIGYDPERDTDNTPDSIFCKHGAGFTVKWNQIDKYMHIPYTLTKMKKPEKQEGKQVTEISEKELEDIMLREFGPIKRPEYKLPEVKKDEIPSGYIDAQKTELLIIDGYNVIFSWEELKSLARDSLEHARTRLTDILVNFASFKKLRLILVFDAYNAEYNSDRIYELGGIQIVYTKKNETGDAYIEKLAAMYNKNDRVRVVSSDYLIQISAVRAGVMRMSAAEFEQEVKAAGKKIEEIIAELKKQPLSSIGERQTGKQKPV
ncbi:MAG: translation factor GTPase family protein, partial [Clostridia bacterium]|nr:translation factor GTPase family protein [Clostridia bacterium]